MPRRVALDRKADLAHPGDRLEELLVGQADPAFWVGLLGYADAHRPGDPAEHWNPPRRHRRAGTTGAVSGDRARNSAAESSTASSAVTQEDRGKGERNRTSGR